VTGRAGLAGALGGRCNDRPVLARIAMISLLEVREPPATPVCMPAGGYAISLGELRAILGAPRMRIVGVSGRFDAHTRQRTTKLIAMTQRVDQQSKCCRVLASARVVEVVAGIWRAPIFKHSLETTLDKMGLREAFGHTGQAQSC
jgi:ribosomal protein L37AE/L43A